jgi:hypothetical protein
VDVAPNPPAASFGLVWALLEPLERAFCLNSREPYLKSDGASHAGFTILLGGLVEWSWPGSTKTACLSSVGSLVRSLWASAFLELLTSLATSPALVLIVTALAASPWRDPAGDRLRLERLTATGMRNFLPLVFDHSSRAKKAPLPGPPLCFGP